MRINLTGPEKLALGAAFVFAVLGLVSMVVLVLACSKAFEATPDAGLSVEFRIGVQ